METIGDYFCVKFHRQMIKGKEECFIAFPIIPYTEMLSLTALRLSKFILRGRLRKKLDFFISIYPVGILI